VESKGKRNYRCKADSCHRKSPKHHYDSFRGRSGLMKPPKFDGNSSFETFLIQFDNCAEHNHWDELDKLHFLRSALTETATQILLGTGGMSYSQLLDRLRSRYGSQEMEAKHLTELQCRRRNKGESFRELAQDIRRLMLMSYPNERSSMSENMAKEYFIAAIDDPELELKVREKEPKNIDAARNYAERLEFYKGTVHQGNRRYARRVAASPDSRSSSLEERTVKRDYSRSKSRQRLHESSSQSNHRDNEAHMSTKRNKKQGKNDDRRVCAINVDDKWKEEFMKEMQELKQNQQKILAENSALSKEVERLRYLEQLRSVPVPASTSVAAPASSSTRISKSTEGLFCM